MAMLTGSLLGFFLQHLSVKLDLVTSKLLTNIAIQQLVISILGFSAMGATTLTRLQGQNPYMPNI